MKYLFLCLVTVIVFTGGSIICKADSIDNFTSLIDKAFKLNASKQIIFVTNERESDFKASLYTYEITENGWREAFGTMKAVIGKKGFSMEKVEGDLKSPSGAFKIYRAFGIPSGPLDTKLEYAAVTGSDYWVDDVTSYDYNKWIKFDGNPYSRWKSFERLKIPLYKYSIIVEYNTESIVKGKGSAIFLHLWNDSSTGTSGCTAVSEENMVKLLKWIDPSKNPLIIQGSLERQKELLDRIENEIIYPVKVRLKEKYVDFDIQPRIINGRVLIPIRSVFEQLGMTVMWKEDSKTVTMNDDNYEIVLKVGDKTAYVNDDKLVLDVPAEIINGRTFVPVRFITESMGYTVEWDSNTRTVFISVIK
ncbi:MAG: L,D-transpeptidase family protein [Clostridiaceae bacterium]|nr:L,D-transpeptidase family protein [Clostridiaceae bacterium]